VTRENSPDSDRATFDPSWSDLTYNNMADLAWLTERFGAERPDGVPALAAHLGHILERMTGDPEGEGQILELRNEALRLARKLEDRSRAVAEQLNAMGASCGPEAPLYWQPTDDPASGF